jgi:rhomboid protease GluP
MNLLKHYYDQFKITTIIISANIMMGLVVLSSGGFDLENLYGWGALWPPAVIINGEWYRVMTSMLLHGNIFHLAMNMYVLFYIGGFMEKILGTYKYLALYVVSGIAAGLSVIYLGDANVITVGASGSIFGIMGALFIMTFLEKDRLPQVIVKQIRTLTLINIGFTFLVPGISVFGHLGGLIAGIIIYFILKYTSQK